MDQTDIIRKISDKFVRKVLKESTKKIQDKKFHKVKNPKAKQLFSYDVVTSTPNVASYPAGSEDVCKPITLKIKRVQQPINSRPFIRHPLSAGYDYRMVRAAFYHNYEAKVSAKILRLTVIQTNLMFNFRKTRKLKIHG